MHRLRGFDYRRTFFYMVTLKRLPGLAAFSHITAEEDPPQDARGRPRYLVANEITRAFARVIRHFHEKWWGLWSIDCFAIMPDHIHVLIHIKDSGDQMVLGKYVYQLMKALAGECWRVMATEGTMAATLGQVPQDLTAAKLEVQWVTAAEQGASVAGAVSSAPIPPIFEYSWHDWIVKKDGQLATFTRYIKENPMRAWLWQRNRRFFGAVRKVTFLDHEWFAYGNITILDLPVLVAVKGHRATKPGSPEWEALVEACGRIGPGGAGVGTFMSPLEKECGNAIAKAGGKWVVLTPDGFHERWHPGREYERFCAEGRMLFLSLYETLDHLPTKRKLYRRCHEMGDLAVAGLELVGESK